MQKKCQKNENDTKTRRKIIKSVCFLSFVLEKSVELAYYFVKKALWLEIYLPKFKFLLYTIRMDGDRSH